MGYLDLTILLNKWGPSPATPIRPFSLRLYHTPEQFIWPLIKSRRSIQAWDCGALTVFHLHESTVTSFTCFEPECKIAFFSAVPSLSFRGAPSRPMIKSLPSQTLFRHKTLLISEYLRGLPPPLFYLCDVILGCGGLNSKQSLWESWPLISHILSALRSPEP